MTTNMFKKIVFPISVAIVLTLTAGLFINGSALAQDKGPGKGPLGPLGRLRGLRPALGQVTSVGEGEFSIETKDGAQRTFTVDDKTRYRGKDKAELSFEDLKSNIWVAVVTGRGQGADDRQRTGLARLVVILPEDFDPTQFEGARGKVVAVNLSASQFTLEKQDGQETVVTTDSETVFRGQATSLADIKEGMFAGVISKETEGDGLVARIVRAGNPVGVNFGEVSAVDTTGVNTAAGTFTLKTQRGGQQLTVEVDEQTRFRSRGDEIAGLEDLKSGMYALVVSKPAAGDEPADTTLKAALVAAGDKSDLPKADLFVGGRIVAVEKGAFTVESREGEQYVFKTSGETRIRSREVHNVNGLKPGMLVLVGAKDLGSGAYQAQVVMVLPRR